MNININDDILRRVDEYDRNMTDYMNAIAYTGPSDETADQEREVAAEAQSLLQDIFGLVHARTMSDPMDDVNVDLEARNAALDKLSDEELKALTNDIVSSVILAVRSETVLTHESTEKVLDTTDDYLGNQD